MGDHYRPAYGAAPPPPPGTSELPPRPEGPPPPYPLPSPSSGPPPSMYHFGSGQAVPSYSSQTSFNFQSRATPSYRSNAPTGPRNSSRKAQSGHSGRDSGRYPPRYRVPTADRPLLRFQRGATPEQLPGMNADESNEQRFVHPNDVSDTSEEAMIQSESDSEDGSNSHDVSRPSPGKQAQVAQPEAGNELPTKAKWSNAELYTALPPPEIAARKKKDIVKLIRKARIAPEKANAGPTSIESSDDFISLDLSSQRTHAPITSGNGLHLTDQKVAVASAGNPSGSAPPAVPTQTDTTIVGKLSEDRKRKRSIDLEDTVKLKQPKLKQSSGQFSGGVMLQEWRATHPSINAIPWHSDRHDHIREPSIRLHKQICDFYDFVRPRPFEEAMRSELLMRLQAFFHSLDSSYTVHSFGSYAAGIYLPNADMDVVVVSQSFLQDPRYPKIGQNARKLNKLAFDLERSGIAQLHSIDIIAKAKVPLIKFVDKTTSLRVDISFENMSGVVANQTFHQWKATFPAMPIIVIVIKQFLLMRGMNEVHTGGLGSFSVTCLVTSLLQNLPQFQAGKTVPEQSLGEVLLEFLDYYGNTFDFRRCAVSMSPAGYIEKRRLLAQGIGRHPDRLMILDPNVERNDISGGSSQVDRVFERFAQAREEILAAMNKENRKCLLDWMLGGNYNNVLWQRRHLKELFEKTSENLSLGDLIPDLNTDSATDKPTVAPIDAVTSDLPIVPTISNFAEESTSVPNVQQKQDSAGAGQPPHARRLSPDEQRAKEFEKNFPHVTDVPSTISRADFKLAIKRAITEAQYEGTLCFGDLFADHNADTQRCEAFTENYPFIVDVPVRLPRVVLKCATKAAKKLPEDTPDVTLDELLKSAGADDVLRANRSVTTELPGKDGAAARWPAFTTTQDKLKQSVKTPAKRLKPLPPSPPPERPLRLRRSERPAGGPPGHGSNEEETGGLPQASSKGAGG